MDWRAWAIHNNAHVPNNRPQRVQVVGVSPNISRADRLGLEAPPFVNPGYATELVA